MHFISAILSVLLPICLATPAKRTYGTHNYYVLEHISSSTSVSLFDVAQALDVEVVEQAGELQNHWIVRKEKNRAELVGRGENIDPVIQAYQGLHARANSPLSLRSDELDHARRIISSVNFLSRQTLRRRAKRAPPPLSPPSPSSSRGIAERLGIQDPMFSQQWHLVNDDFPEHMMNVTPVWDMGFTGKGVISSLVDDGLDYESEDLAANFVRKPLSFSV